MSCIVFVDVNYVALFLYVFFIITPCYKEVIVHQFRSVLESYETAKVDNQLQTGCSVRHVCDENVGLPGGCHLAASLYCTGDLGFVHVN